MKEHIALNPGNVLAVTMLAVLGLSFVAWTTSWAAHSSNPTLQKFGTAGQYVLHAA